MKRHLILSSLLGGLSLTMAVGLLGSSAWLIAMASTQPPILVLEVAIVSVRFFGLSRGLFRYGERVLSHNEILKAQTHLQVLVYRGIERAIPFHTRKSSDFYSALIRDVELIQDRWLRIYIPWISAGIAGFAGLAAIYYLSHSAGVIIGILLLIALFVLPALSQLLASRESQKSYLDEIQIIENVAGVSRGFLEARIYGYSDQLAKSLHSIELSLANSEKRIDKGSGIGSALNILLTGSAVCTGFVIAVHDSLIGMLGAVNIATLTLLPLMIFDGVGQLPSAFALLGRIKKAENNVLSLTSNGSDEIISAKVPLQFDIELRNVRARWQTERLRHQPISTVIKPGMPLLIGGESGVGKSSLALSLIGLIPHEGEITIGGIPITEIDCPQYVTLSMQNDHLFNSSIRENIRIGNPTASDEDISTLLELLELDTLVNSLPDKLDTLIGTYGVNFSGGEKQRLRLARALIRQTPIVILDEPFEFLEKEQAERIAQNVFTLLREKTLLVISHDQLSITHTARINLGVEK